MLLACSQEVHPATVPLPPPPAPTLSSEPTFAQQMAGTLYYEIHLALAWHGPEEANACTLSKG